MANVHRIGDYQNNGQGGNYYQMGNQESQLNMGRLQQMRVPFITSGNRYQGDPRKETFPQMLKLNLCPSLKLFSFTIFIILLNVLIFVSMCTQGINKQGQLLEIRIDVLDEFGANNAQKIQQKYQLWRLFTAMFLHLNFIHILFNSVSAFILVSVMEYTYGTLYVIIIYILSGIGGNLFTDMFSSVIIISAGASTSLMGMLALFVSYMVLNWKSLEFTGQLRCMFVCITTIIIIWVFLLSSGFSTKSGVDNFGHLGGFITGLLAGICIPKPFQQTDYEMKAKFISGGLLAFFLGLMLILFYTVVKL
ncbi:rhomboid family protein, putative [Ichthyophthirius multifiliis]|uniref:Rhomboid-like protease n=1 Tax=Ichthyophthirius multifiliis TaxID=5932 RepID=G0QZU3_ICHMU|nr:rhomboid family protein, putative [Ichthyophthirius multifiliis]EGR29263.1 rhomboid family protein, putative [Ichthyophthirius multifiliis]|eukprot:XP_004030499.1 rhomboid family protein, putative [Ichthyophthirius multifiliis]